MEGKGVHYAGAEGGFMKKRIYSSVLAVALILISVVCLTACGGDQGVNLHGKVYTLGEEVTWSAYSGSGDDKQIIADPVAYLTEHWESVKQQESLAENMTPAQFYAQKQAAILTDKNNILLKGGVIKIGAPNKKSESVWESSLELFAKNGTKITETTIQSDTFNKDRYRASFISADYVGSEFKLVNYNSKDGSINDILVRIRFTKPVVGSENGEEVERYSYDNRVGGTIRVGEDMFFYIEVSVSLKTVGAI